MVSGRGIEAVVVSALESLRIQYELIEIDPELFTSLSAKPEGADEIAWLASRAAALRRRARALKNVAILDRRTRARLNAAIARHTPQ